MFNISFGSRMIYYSWNKRRDNWNQWRIKYNWLIYYLFTAASVTSTFHRIHSFFFHLTVFFRLRAEIRFVTNWLHLINIFYEPFLPRPWREIQTEERHQVSGAQRLHRAAPGRKFIYNPRFFLTVRRRAEELVLADAVRGGRFSARATRTTLGEKISPTLIIIVESSPNRVPRWWTE